MTRRWLVATLVFLATLAGSRLASAQGLPNEAYRDIKSIIEELLTEELAHSIVPSVACLGGRREVTAEEAAARKAGERHYPVKIDGRFYVLELIENYPRTLQHIYNRQFATLKSTVRDESADFAAHTVYKALTAPTDATVKALEAKLAGLAEQNGGVAYDPLHRTETTALIFSEEIAFSTCKKEIATYFDGNVSIDPNSPLDSACGPEDAGGKGNDYACNVAFALRALLQDKAALSEEFLVRAAADVIAEAIAASANANAYPRALVDVVILATREFLYERDSSVDKLARTIVAAGGSYITIPGADTSAQEAFVKQAVSDVERLRTQWSVATNVHTAKLELASYVETIATTSGYLGRVCADKTTLPSCKALVAQQKALARGAELWSIVRLSSRGDYRDVAQRSIGAMFAAAESQKRCAGANCDKLKLYRRFAESVVAYVLEADESQPRAETTRQAFRAAATDVIRELGQGGGLDRSGLSPKTIFLPDLALRFSWSSAYVNQDGAGYRTLASADMLKARRTVTRTDVMYFAVQGSAVDPIAPLNELALRKSDAIFTDTSLLAWNLITPRLDLLVGVPALSKHLVASAGISLRAVAPFAMRAENDPAKVLGYQYRGAFDEHVLLGKEWPRFVEFGFAIKYLL